MTARGGRAAPTSCAPPPTTRDARRAPVTGPRGDAAAAAPPLAVDTSLHEARVALRSGTSRLRRRCSSPGGVGLRACTLNGRRPRDSRSFVGMTPPVPRRRVPPARRRGRYAGSTTRVRDIPVHLVLVDVQAPVGSSRPATSWFRPPARSAGSRLTPMMSRLMGPSTPTAVSTSTSASTSIAGDAHREPRAARRRDDRASASARGPARSRPGRRGVDEEELAAGVGVERGSSGPPTVGRRQSATVPRMTARTRPPTHSAPASSRVISTTPSAPTPRPCRTV